MSLDGSSKNKSISYGKTRNFLHQAIKLDKPIARIETMLGRGCTVNDSDKDGEVPLHTAVRENKSEIVQVLLKSGSHIHALNNQGESPLDLINNQGSPQMMKVFDKFLSKQVDSITQQIFDPSIIPIEPLANIIGQYARSTFSEKGMERFIKQRKIELFLEGFALPILRDFPSSRAKHEAHHKAYAALQEQFLAIEIQKAEREYSVAKADYETFSDKKADELPPKEIPRKTQIGYLWNNKISSERALRAAKDKYEKAIASLSAFKIKNAKYEELIATIAPIPTNKSDLDHREALAALASTEQTVESKTDSSSSKHKRKADALQDTRQMKKR
jgi:hypothetical protein